MYRVAARPPPPRTLVVHPQRAGTALVFMVFGAFMTWKACTLEKVRSAADLGVLVLIALFPFGFFLVGLHAWFRKARLELWEDGRLVVRTIRWPFRSNAHELSVADVVDVVAEPSSESRRSGRTRILIVTRTERIPLTRSATSDDLSKKVAGIKTFLGLDATPPLAP